MSLRRYWIRFESSTSSSLPPGFGIGCGVTAFSYDDMLSILAASVFRGGTVPTISSVEENVDVSSLDQGRVIPNMGVPTRRGVWFPRGYD